jgi:DNA modification methylase
VANGKDCQLQDSVRATSTFRNPKRNRVHEITSRAGWFPYYAGFSVGFVEDVISHLNLPYGASLLDPWLGAGTTTQVGTALGLDVRGYDLNPSMLLVARARTLPTNSVANISTVAESITSSFKKSIDRKRSNWSNVEIDPLEQWLQPNSVYVFRILERTIETNTLGTDCSATLIPLWRRVGDVSPLLALFYVCLFRTLRHFLTEFKSSNPTWVKIPYGGKRVQLSPDRLLNRFQREIASLVELIRTETTVMPFVRAPSCIIEQASSLKLPLESNSIDAAISSPPYCTRIDYVKATLPELAVIGYPNGELTRHLREMMIGTPTIVKNQHCRRAGVDDSSDASWGTTCARFLSSVENHSSKASSTYYLKYYRQYFSSVFCSLREIDRVLKKSAKCVLVIQDSYYKEVPNNLPRVFIEMATHLGWTLTKQSPFHVKQTLAGVNPGVRPYRKTFHAIESTLVFSK